MADSNTEIQLPSGAKLVITISPFDVAMNLYQACLEEIRKMTLDPNAEIDANFYKDLFCAGFGSKKIEGYLWECMKRALYNGEKVTKDTFEPEEARQDFMKTCMEVGRVNIAPFVKNLFAEYSSIISTIQSIQA